MAGSRRGKEAWSSLFDEYERSGLSAAAFCRERGLPGPYFRIKYRQCRGGAGGKVFSKVQLSTVTAPVSISVGAVQIRCDSSLSSTWLVELIRQLAGLGGRLEASAMRCRYTVRARFLPA